MNLSLRAGAVLLSTCLFLQTGNPLHVCAGETFSEINTVIRENPAGEEETDMTKTADEDITIIQATDPHYLSPSLTDGGESFAKVMEQADGKVTIYSNDVADAFISKVIEEKPDCLLLTGDLSFNGERQSLEELAQKLCLVKEAGIPVLVIPGNHDLNNSMARKYTGSTLSRIPSCSSDEFAQIFADFGYRDALDRDPSSLSYVYALRNDFWILNIDANVPGSTGILKEATIDWAESVLKKAKEKGAAVISATHQTLFNHNKLFTDGFRIANDDRLIQLYKIYGVKLNLCGHMHLQHVRQEDGITDIVTSALTVTPCHYAKIILHADKTFDYTTEETDVTAWALKQGLITERETASRSAEERQTADYYTDRRWALSDFHRYAEEYFLHITSLKKDPEVEKRSLKQGLQQKLIDDMSRFNLCYFTGHMEKIKDFKSILTEWQNAAGSSFTVIYLMSIVPGDLKNMNLAAGEF